EKHSSLFIVLTFLSVLFSEFQFSKENPFGTNVPQVQVKGIEDMTEDNVATTLRRAIKFYSTLQAHDGHWAGDCGGPMFLMPGLVISFLALSLLDMWLFSKENPLGTNVPQVQVKGIEDMTEDNVATTLRRAIKFYSTLQAHDGHWAGDCGGPMFLMPGLNCDGGWGLHIESHSTMFGSVMSYVTLRLLGEGANGGEGEMEKGRKWILDHGSATAIASWGKMWLSVLGVFDWSGNNPLLPEIWLLPYFLPFHPGRMWSHCRMVYLPMSYLYGKKFVGPITPIVSSLRNELFTVPYDEINWNKARNECAKVLNMLCCWAEDPNSEGFKLHLPRLYDYLWIAEDGMKMQSKDDVNAKFQGSNGSQSWDTSFAIQAIISTNLVEEYGPTLRKAHKFMKDSQACLLLSKLPLEIVGEPLKANSMYDAVNVMLSLQNPDGGIGTYELSRSYPWLEVFSLANNISSMSIIFAFTS
ncbi:hypothetical protein H5410_022471, partial [Solanum commersonii]